ncbi:MAG: tetratricopeptide repeat protein [Candidatus Rokuibacteriota bacterium]
MSARRLGALALVVLAFVPAPALAGPTREEALSALADTGNADRRRRGAESLGDTGLMTDLPRLAAALRDSDPLVRDLAESAMWQVWSRSGDPTIDELFQTGVAQMRGQQGEQAVDTFSEIIRRRPEFAEGWNKRATVYYLLGEYRKSLADCDEVMKRNPYHFGALSGYGMIYLQLDQPATALEYFERALRVNPNLESTRQTIDRLKTLLIQRRKDTI